MREIVPKGSYIMSQNETPSAMAASLNDLLKNPDQIRQMSEIMLKHREEVLISKRIKILEKYMETSATH